MRKFAQADFPKLSGPTNFMDCQTEFKRAMIISNYWGFFSGGYNGGLGTAWYEAGYQQAIVFLQESCTKEKAMEIQYETDPIIAFGTTQASCGTAKDFKAAMLNINRQLVAMNPKYGKPMWEMNSWFINNLTDAYEKKVSALSSNPKAITIEGGMSFDDLCLEIIEEEQRLTEKNGITTTTVAIAATKTNTQPSAFIRVRADQITSPYSGWNSISMAPGIYVLGESYGTYRVGVNTAYFDWLVKNNFEFERDEPTGPVRTYGEWLERRDVDTHFIEDSLMAILHGRHLTLDKGLRGRAQKRHRLRFEWEILGRDAVSKKAEDMDVPINPCG
ncbi:hypothetical protein B0J14DRAFT_658856 [Halenospora varia]|nr:hypothetical protein B0J14DRAFT_658856 [Halenospora varia]